MSTDDCFNFIIIIVVVVLISLHIGRQFFIFFYSSEKITCGYHFNTIIIIKIIIIKILFLL